MSTTIRVSTSTKARIATLAEASGTSMTAVVDAAVEALERRRFFAALDARYEELHADKGVWRDVQEERAIECSVLRDT